MEQEIEKAPKRKWTPPPPARSLVMVFDVEADAQRLSLREAACSVFRIESDGTRLGLVDTMAVDNALAYESDGYAHLAAVDAWAMKVVTYAVAREDQLLCVCSHNLAFDVLAVAH